MYFPSTSTRSLPVLFAETRTHQRPSLWHSLALHHSKPMNFPSLCRISASAGRFPLFIYFAFGQSHMERDKAGLVGKQRPFSPQVAEGMGCFMLRLFGSVLCSCTVWLYGKCYCLVEAGSRPGLLVAQTRAASCFYTTDSTWGHSGCKTKFVVILDVFHRILESLGLEKTTEII